MRRSAILSFALVLALLVSACGDGRGPSVKDLEIRIEAGRGEVDLGRGFPLAVVRTWDRDLVPAPFATASLAPLVVRAVGTERREIAGRVEETLRFTAYAMQFEEVRVAPPRLEATPAAGGATRSVAGSGLALRVRPALDPKNPGRPEPPGPPPAPPGGSRTWLAILAGVLVAAAAAALLRPRRAAGPTPVSAADRARRRLDALGADVDAGPFHDELDGLLREYLAGRHGLRTRERTTEEILGEPGTERALGTERRRALVSLLDRCDRARFAGERSGPAAHRAATEDARAFVEAAA